MEYSWSFPQNVMCLLWGFTFAPVLSLSLSLSLSLVISPTQKRMAAYVLTSCSLGIIYNFARLVLLC